MVVKLRQCGPPGVCRGTRTGGANRIPAAALRAELLLTAQDPAQAFSSTLNAHLSTALQHDQPHLKTTKFHSQ